MKPCEKGKEIENQLTNKAQCYQKIFKQFPAKI